MRKLMWASLATLALAGCNCDGTEGKTAYGQVTVDEKQLDFGTSCPKPSNPAYEVQLPTKTLHLHNAGNATSNLNVFKIQEGFEDVFVWEAAKVPATIGQGDAVDIDITFQPKTGGTVTAKLTVQGDRPDDEDKIEITLLGEGKAFDPVPIASTECLSANIRTPGDGCTPASPGVPRIIRFKATPAGGFLDVPVTIKNGGCPTLKVQAITVQTTGSDDDKEGFSLQGGQTALTVLGGNSEPGTVVVRFSPKTGAGTVYYGELTFETNDPVNGTFTIKLDGEGTDAQIFLDKTECDFSKLVNPCDGRFFVRNAGEVEFTINSVFLESNSPLFRITDAASFVGLKVPPASQGGQLAQPIIIEYVPGAARDADDRLMITSTAGPADAVLKGGSPPFMDVPAIVDFGLELSHNDHYAELPIQNVLTYNRQLDLTLENLVIDDPHDPDRFDIVTSGNMPNTCPDAAPFAPNTKVAPGETFTACVHFKSDDFGGLFNAMLSIDSDDPSYSAPRADRLVQLSAQATCASKPTAIVEVRNQGPGSTCPCTANTCPATTCGVTLPTQPGATGTVVVSGEGSYSQGYQFDGTQCVADTRTGVAEYEWALSFPLDGSASIEPEGRSTSATTTLSFKKAGVHILTLKVYDAAGHESAGNPTSYTVTVSTN